jgi:two-component system cell cycle response regulator CtrA
MCFHVVDAVRISVRIFLIEQDSGASESVQNTLFSLGFNVSLGRPSQRGAEHARNGGYDLVCLGATLSQMRCGELLEQWRSAPLLAPVLILAGKLDRNRKLALLALGADDVVSQPFDPEEVRTRIRGMVRRSKGHAAPIITVGKLSVDMLEQTARISGTMVHLTPKEFITLEVLALHAPAVVTKFQLAASLYPNVTRPGSTTIESFVSTLRKKLSSVCQGEEYIITDRTGDGYFLSKPARSASVG